MLFQQKKNSFYCFQNFVFDPSFVFKRATVRIQIMKVGVTLFLFELLLRQKNKNLFRIN